MPAADTSARDLTCIGRILKYCIQIRESLDEISNDSSRFMHSHTYQNAVSMCIMQIGELAKQLSPDFRATHTAIPWNLIARTRDSYAHHYGAIDFELVWETAISDIPEVARFCSQFLASQ